MRKWLFIVASIAVAVVTYLTNQITAPVAAVQRDAAGMLGWIRQLPDISIGALGGLIADPDVSPTDGC
jgi:hypothetical protein